MSQPHAVLVGVGPGLGLALARRFAEGGYRLTLLLHPDQDPSIFPEARLLAADLGDPEALVAVLPALGEPELLVYHAASGARGALLERRPGDLARDFQVNALSLLACVRQIRPAMRARGKGCILVTGGGLALQPKPGEGATALGKAAQRSLALTLAQELAPEGIHVATVTVAGFLKRGTPFNPEVAAEAYWELHREPQTAWRQECVLSP